MRTSCLPVALTWTLVFRWSPILAAAALMCATPARAGGAPIGASPPPAATATPAPPPAYPPPPASSSPPSTAYPPPPTPLGSSATGYPSPPFAAAPGQGVYVELQSDNPNTRIDRLVEGVAVPVCLLPCRRVLDRNNIYVIGGDGVRSTSQFLLPDNHDRVTLSVKAGSSSQLAGGAVLMVVGGAVGYAGLFLWELSVVSTSVANANGNTNVRRGNAGLGLGLMTVGLAGVAIGAYLALTAHTTVASSTGATFSETPTSRRKRSFFAFALTPQGLEF